MNRSIDINYQNHLHLLTIKQNVKMMKVKWRKLFVETSAWVTAEVVLNVVGLDNLADYSEFVFQSKAMLDATEAFSNLITLVS